MPFYKKKQEIFRTTKIDIAVTIIMFIAFYLALFGLSFTPLLNETGEPVESDIYWRETGDPHICIINDFVIMGGLILCYEALLVRLVGKKRGRYLPWSLWYRMFLYDVKLKIQEGKEFHQEWKNRKKHK